MAGTIEDIFIAPTGGAPMRRVHLVQAEAGAGLTGDRYRDRTGYWTNVDECQVTLIAAESLEAIAAAGAIEVGAGQHRRNIVTRGVDLHSLQGKRFAVGRAVFEYDRPRPPCGYIQGLTQRGMTKALGGDRGGICARVVASGTISRNDAIEVLAATP